MLNFTCNYWQESCTLARLWICHPFVNSTQKIQTEINKRAWQAPGHPDASTHPDACACPVCCARPACLISLTTTTCLACPACGCNRVLVCLHYMVLHVRMQARAWCCAFHFILCCAPMHADAGGDHPFSCPPYCCIPRFASVLRTDRRACRWGPDLHLQHQMQHPRNIWNIYLKRMKYTTHANENTCNTRHLLQHTSEIGETFKTHSCNICIANATYATYR
jgi:hypothetical protein